MTEELQNEYAGIVLNEADQLGLADDAFLFAEFY
jgi:hypothetical protein